MLFQIEIPKRNGQCAGKGERILPGMEYFSLLLSNDINETVRQDYCIECWPERKEQEGFYSKGHWKSKVDEKIPATSNPKSDQAFHLLKEFMKERGRYEEEIFVLVLFLSHAKKLVLRKEFQAEGAVWGLYENPRQEEFFTIKILSLTQLEADRIQKTLAERLLEGVLKTK